MRKILIGTRGSQLAIWQASYVENTLISSYPEISIERVIIKTEGDRDQKSSLTRIGGQGVFTKAIEDALLNKKIDIAVHSLKDLPSQMAHGLVLGAVPERGPVEDVLVTKDGRSFMDLPNGAKVATGSIRRKSQLLNLRTDIHIADLRGNIDTRLRKLQTQNLDAIIMARAALVRLKLNDVRYYTFKLNEIIPAVGQGAVGVQIREDDEEVRELVGTINDKQTFQAVEAERAFLHELDSGCQFPVGAYGVIRQNRLHLNGFVGSEDGQTVLIDQVESEPSEAEAAGQRLAQQLIQRGALDLLKLEE